MNKYWLHITVGIVAILLVGIAIPKLTVHDLVPVETRLRQCATLGVTQHLDNPLERIALFLGESRITRADNNNGIEVESFTIFRIPLGILRGQPDMKLGVFCSPAGDPSGTQVMESPSFADGDTVGLGVFHDSPIANGVKAYQSERLGISFKYPPDYLLFEGKGEGVGGVEYYVITVALEMYVREAIARIGGGEWPASMHLSFYREPTLAVSNIVPLDYLENWIRTKSQSNFVPSDPAQEGILTPTEVAGIPALKYRVRGLYDSDYLAFTYGEWVVLASADDMGENTDRDFQVILDSIQVGPAHTYTNKSLGFSIDKPTGVYFIGEENGVVAFSLLSPNDPRQASSIGLVNVLTITSARTTPEEGKESEINGVRVVVSSTYGAYGGEKHWSYFFSDHDLLIQYVENKPIYESMISTIRFDE
ncbi:MAG TPA: hypothetical protein VI981_03100 [Candidatus Paceibacterota bacterium]